MFLRSNGDDLMSSPLLTLFKIFTAQMRQNNKHQQHSVQHPQQVEAREAKIDSTKQPSSVLPHPGDLCLIRMLGPEKKLIHLYRKRRMVCMRLFRPEPTSSCPVPTCSGCWLVLVSPVIEKCKLPPIHIFDKNCPLKRVNQKFAIFRQNVRKLELFW